jgi:hypothetical protein
VEVKVEVDVEVEMVAAVAAAVFYLLRKYRLPMVL